MHRVFNIFPALHRDSNTLLMIPCCSIRATGTVRHINNIYASASTSPNIEAPRSSNILGVDMKRIVCWILSFHKHNAYHQTTTPTLLVRADAGRCSGRFSCERVERCAPDQQCMTASQSFPQLFSSDMTRLWSLRFSNWVRCCDRPHVLWNESYTRLSLQNCKLGTDASCLTYVSLDGNLWNWVTISEGNLWTQCRYNN